MAGGGGNEVWTPERSAAGARSPWLIASIVSLATFMEVLDTSIANVSLDHIAGSLSSSYDEATWILTSYLIANAIAIPIAGRLSNIVGRKRFYMLSVAIFTISSFFCGIASSLTFLIVARVVQGIGGGGLQPSEQAILADTFPPEKRGGAFALYGLTVISAPILGPTVGGIITDNASWHWIFLLNVPVGLLSLFLVHTFVVDPPKLEEERQARLKGGLKVDSIGIALLILWLGFQEFVLDRGQHDDWLHSPAIKVSLIIAVVSFIGFIIWEWNHKEPVLDLRLLAKPSYAISVVVMIATGAVITGSSQLIPQFAQQVLNYSASDAGKAMTLGGVITILMMPLAGILSGKMQPKWLIMAALTSEAVALIMFTRLNGEVSWWWVALSRMTLAIGIPFLFIPINTAAYADVPTDKTAAASAQLNLARNLGGSLAISIAQALIVQRAQEHQARLVETVTSGSANYLSWTSQLTAALRGQGAAGGQLALAQIYQSLQQQSQVLAYIDTFWVYGIAVGCVVPLIIFMKKIKLGGSPA